MRYLYYQDKKGEWRWRLRAENNRIIAVSGEGYINQADCLHAIDLIRGAGWAPALAGPEEKEV